MLFGGRTGAMNHLRSPNLWRRFLPPGVDVILFYAALAGAMAARGNRSLDLYAALAYLPFVAVWMATMYTVGLYELRLLREDPAFIKNLLVSAAVCVVAGTGYFYLVGDYAGITPKTHLVLTVAFSHALVYAWRKVWLTVLRFDLLDQSFVFLGSGQQLRELEAAMSHHHRDTGLSVGPWQYPGVDIVVVDAAWVDANWESERTTLLAAMARGVPIVTLEDFYESVFGKVSPYYAASPSWAIDHILPKNLGVYASVKRAIDLIGTVVLGAVFAPFLAGTALAIYLTEGGPVFYCQERVGLLGKPFTLWKFRTMRSGADKHGALLAADALTSHVTPLGDFLRRYRLDELPQLWNVLRGEMSFVGPRPEWMKEVEILEVAVPSNHLRHLVKPGLTGWAQVKFRQTNTVEDAIERLHYDLYYVKNWSFGLDVSILLKTVKRVLVSDSSVEAVPTPAMPLPMDASWVLDLATTYERRYDDLRPESLTR